MGQRIPEKEIANFQSYGEIESMHEFEFVDLVNSDLVDSESRKHRENRAFMGMIRIVSLM